MQFLYPAFLFALAALALPIIIHLFYFRRFKKVYFTNVRFLKEIKEETSNRQKLRNLLVLAMRLLALAFLVFAFAQPFIPQDQDVAKGKKAVSIFIDNSFSMSALSQDVALIDKAKIRAREIVEAYAPDDEFQILTNDFEGRHQRMVSRDEALALIDEIKTGPAVRELSRVFSRQQQILNSSGIDNHVVYHISDFQKNIADLENIKDTLTEIELIPLQSVQEKNVSLDSVWFEAPLQLLNQTNSMLVKVRNTGDEAAENVKLSLRHDGQTKPVGTLNIPAKSSITDTVPITILKTGWHEGELALTDYPVQFDDKYFFSFFVSQQINVLIVNELTPNNYLDAAFRSIPNFNAINQNSKSLEYSKFPTYQMIVLNELKTISSGLAAELKQFVDNGGNILVFPAADADVNSYKSFSQTFPVNELTGFEKTPKTVGTVNVDEFIFKDVFENKSANLKLPTTTGAFKLSGLAATAEERLLSFRDGSAYLSKFVIEKGHVYLCAAPLSADYNDLVKSSEVFIPMLYKMAISSSKEQKLAYVLGRDEVIETDIALEGGSESVFKLAGEEEEFIPEQRIVSSKVFLTVGEQVKKAGDYRLFQKSDEMLARFAFNYDRKESDLEYFSKEDLLSLTEQSGAKIKVINSSDEANFTDLIGERSQGIVLWRWCLVLVLLFLALEGLIIRVWKV